jgi:MFS family permease
MCAWRTDLTITGVSMCAACGVPTHVPVWELDQPEPAEHAGPLTPPAKFAALRSPSCRVYLGGGMLAMMADNIEHVITYWVLWQKFHSSALTGFEVISHWLPFLLLSPYFGALADRHACRKLIQGAQLLFMAVSVCWGLLFMTRTLQIWNACFTVGIFGAVVGLRWSLGLSAAAMCVGTAVVAAHIAAGTRRAAKLRGAQDAGT